MEDILSYTSLNKGRIEKICSNVNKLESKYSSLSDYELSKMTDRFRFYLREGKSIDYIMEDALAVCKEAIKRKLDIVPYDTQIMAAAAMSDNIIAEMQTGEGKTLVQILSAYLYALNATKDLDKSKWGNIHILTANEYLAKRDKEQNEKVFNLLGLSCGYVEEKSKLDNPNYHRDKQKAYRQDIVYGTAKTVAFDYLDDNQLKDVRRRFFKRELYHAIVDEADDILLDQALSPLILSGTLAGVDVMESINFSNYACYFVNGVKGYRNTPVTCHLANQFNRNRHDEFNEDSIIFKDCLRIFLSEDLMDEIYKDKTNFQNVDIQEKLFNKEVAITNAILAKYFFKRNKQYILKEVGRDIDTDGKLKRVYEVTLISEATGRQMPKTKYRDGIQEAIEAQEAFLAKGKYIVKRTNRKIDRSVITYPEFAKLYKTGISGMTGTSDIEDFRDIYNLETYEVPTRIPSIRKDEETELYSTKEYKYEAIVRDIYQRNQKLQPILVGTISVEESDELCKYLDKYGIKYQRLDAMNEQDEALKIEKAGKKGMITVATNMAGRGTDIKLDEDVKALGGLYVIGVSKNKNKRIDRQLMGRCARQGDPGETKYYQSLDDELILSRYGKAKLLAYKKYYADQQTKINNPRVIDMVNKCQEREESLSKEDRKNKNEIQTRVFSAHRKKMFEQRNRILESTNKDFVYILMDIIRNYATSIINNPEEANKARHLVNVEACYNEDSSIYRENIASVIFNKFKNAGRKYDINEYMLFVKTRFLDIIDSYWVSHLMHLEDMERTILNSGIFTVDTIDEFEIEANKLFADMSDCIKNEMLTYAIYPNMEIGSYVLGDSSVIGGDIRNEITR